MMAALSRAREWLTLLAVAGVAAWLYVQLQHVRTDRDRILQWAAVTCAGSGVGYAPGVKGKPGEACAARVADLARFKATSDERTAQLLAKALEDAADRQLTDNLAARAAAEAARSAALRMEAADAEAAAKNLVDREWFAAVNGVAGLRAAAPPRR